MTEPVSVPSPAALGASDVINSDHSAMFAARAEIESLKVDKEFGRLRLTRGDPGAVAPPEVAAAKARWADLHHKGYPPVIEIKSPSDALQQQRQRNTAAMDEYVAGVKQKLPLSPQQ